MNRIVVAEYPKSGGSWFVSLLADSLAFSKRDIYVSDGFNLFDISTHPWYENTQSLELSEFCVIKSHELPGSPLHNFSSQFIHLIRDGRDVAVSKYFYEKDFCVRNGILREFTMPFDEYIEKVSCEWAAYVTAWLKKDILTCQYENLLQNTFSTLQKVLNSLELLTSNEKINASIQANTKEKMRNAWGKVFQYNTFVRKGITGDWKNHFSEHHREIFKRCAGEVLIKLGYENDINW